MVPTRRWRWPLALLVGLLALVLCAGVACACELPAQTADGILHMHATGDGCAAAADAAAGEAPPAAAAAEAARTEPAEPIVLSNADTATPEGLFRYDMPSAFFSLENFPGFRVLQDHWEEIRDEAVAIKEVLNLNRKQNEWNEGAANFVERIIEQQNRGWTVAWGGDGLWLNYALVYYNTIMPGVTEELAPKTVALLRQIPGIRVGGFSKLLPGAYIAPHHDSTGPKFHSMAFHLCLTGRASLRVGANWVEQAPGKVLIFDSTINHEVKNGDEERIILYLDFDIDAFLRATEEGYDPSATLSDDED